MQSGTVNVGGTLDASGTGAGQTGGSVTVTGNHVGLFGAHINASGDAGGGTVLIGGGYQGNNPAVQNASATYMSADSTITADAITNGNGGTVVLWSNDSTRAYGSITARGGAQGGDGGLIETSGHWLDVCGHQRQCQRAERQGRHLAARPGRCDDHGAGTTNETLTAGVFSPDSGVKASTIDAAALGTALEAGGGTNITITTTNTRRSRHPASGLGNITIASALTWTPVATATLTLNAAGDVNINAASYRDQRQPGGVLRPGHQRERADYDDRGCCHADTGGNVLLSAGRDVNIVRTAATSHCPS